MLDKVRTLTVNDLAQLSDEDLERLIEVLDEGIDGTMSQVAVWRFIVQLKPRREG